MAVRALTAACALAVAATACGSTAVTSVTPSGVRCGVSLSSSFAALSGPGGTGEISVTTQPDCGWTASTSAAWIVRLAPAEGHGASVIQFDAAPNTTPQPRSAGIVVNDVMITVQQAPCQFEVSPPDFVISAAGGERSVLVASEPGCRWSAAVQDPWIVVTAGSSGDGDGAVTLQVARNTGKSRTATLMVAGRSVTVLQLAPSLGLPLWASGTGAPALQHPAAVLTIAANHATNPLCRAAAAMCPSRSGIMEFSSTGSPAWRVPVTVYAPAAGS